MSSEKQVPILEVNKKYTGFISEASSMTLKLISCFYHVVKCDLQQVM